MQRFPRSDNLPPHSGGFRGPGIWHFSPAHLPKPAHPADSGRIATAFGASWLKHVAADGRVYPRWHQIGAASGRMSCSTPNMQQLPRGNYRRCIAVPTGRVLIKADYSQVELRIAAKMSGDAALLDAYKRGDDLHSRTARTVLGVADVTKEHRQLAKALNFGLLFGMGVRTFRLYAKGQYGLDLADGDAGRYRGAFFRTYPGLAAWHRRVMATRARETRTLAGRRRFLDAAAFDTLRLNTPVQGRGRMDSSWHWLCSGSGGRRRPGRSR